MSRVAYLAALAVATTSALLAPVDGARAESVNASCYGSYVGEPNSDFSSAENASDYFVTSGSQCTAPTSSGASRWDTAAYVGVSFSIGDGFKPHLDLGVRSTNANTSGFVYGAEVNASISMLKGFADTQVRLLGLAGGTDVLNTDLLGNAGIGWDFGKAAMLLNAGVQVPYARAFVDYIIKDASSRAFLEANSYGKIAPVAAKLSCSEGTLENGTQINSDFYYISDLWPVGDIFTGSLGDTDPFFHYYDGTPSAAFINGQTCFTLGSTP